jgi:ABC-type transport system involved in multi-copper enzyme maturation permease subunit
MLSIYNIATIAKYEQRILFRSWFFRIFAILSLVIIGLFSAIFLFDRGPFNWAFRSLPSALAYSNFFLLNIFQSVIAVFLATDFLKRDKKLDTSEVLFIRPMSNFEYVTGKTVGLITVFVALNLLVMLLTSIFVWASGQIPYRVVPMIYYFLLVSIPTLVFVVGFAYTLMSIVKNQAITFILLLGYIALVIFYLAAKQGYIFDYMVFKMPVPYSDIIGFSDFEGFFIHRLSYFMAGFGLILFTTWRLKRKANNAASLWALSFASLLTLIIASAGFAKLITDRNQLEKSRVDNSSISAAYFDKAVPLMRKASITFEQGNVIKARSEMSLRNKSGQTIDTLYFSLNPGLKVEKALAGSDELTFSQEKMLVKVIPASAMRPGDDLIVTLEYTGLPDFSISYLDVENDKLNSYESQVTIAVDKKYGFYTNEYVLLTKENLWYPIPGIAYDPLRPAIFRQQFTRFDLTVKTQAGMVPVSQGEREGSDSLGYHFTIRDPLPQLSLNIARFEEKSLKAGEISILLAHIKGHDYFTNYFTELKDTAAVLITDFLNDFERPLGMYYPYKQFSIVEVPVQFSSQPHTWTSTLAQSQPQMVYLPEWGYNVRQADFKTNGKRIKRDSERNKEGLEEKEIQARVFTNFLKGVFTASQEEVGFGPPSGETVGSNPYSIFPNYFYYVNYITSPDCPVLNYAFESYFQKGEDDPRQLFFSSMNGIGDDEKANLKLKKKSLKEVIDGDEEQTTVARVLKAKGAYLLSWMEKQTQSSDFRKFMLDYLYNNSYKEIKYEELAGALSARLNIGMGNFIGEWYNTKGLPAFNIGEVKAFETIGESQVVYLVRTKVTNSSKVPGLIKFSFMLGEGGRGRGGFGFGGFNQSEPEVRTYLLNGNETKEFQVLLTESPRSLIFNTLIAENIPSKKMVFNIPVDKDQRIKAEEYEKVVDKPVEFSSPGDLIVDNTDSTFSVFDPSVNNPIRKLFAKKSTSEEDKFVGQGFGPPPTTWSLSANTDYYGTTEQSALVVRSGDGSKTATWKRAIPAAGYYDVYVYLSQGRRFGPGRRDDDPQGKYVYTVSHDDGDEEIELEMKDIESGWNLLGSFYISSDTAVVRLSDKGGADRVVADAVKWIQQR